MRVVLWTCWLLVAAAAPAPASEGFAVADGPREWSFPADHGSHPAFATEWWYCTGALSDGAGRDFGYELTFFRTAMRRHEVESVSPWRARDLVLAHVALTDVRGDRFLQDEAVQRASGGLAGADVGSLRVWLGSWEMVQRGDGFAIDAATGEFALELALQPTKGPVRHGPGGHSIKDAAGRQASYYYSMPRLATRGRLRLGGEWIDVAGMTWFDHEFFSGDTPVEGLGWDWFSARLADGRDLMLYRVRHPGGERYDFGTLIGVDGRPRPLDMAGLELTPLEHWTSPETGRRYPVAWSVRAPAEGLELEVRARLPQQEIRAQTTVGFPYWEGLSRYEGTLDGQPIRGTGYVELTGY